MVSRTVNFITGLIGCGMLATFIFGLAHSISIGFAGFWGGLPFWVIALSVLSMVAYEFWSECIRNRNGLSEDQP